MPPPVALTARDVLVFEHIHKTAGTTLGEVLRRRYRGDLFVHHGVARPQRKMDELAARIGAGRPPRAIVSHLGYGFHERLPGSLRYVYLTLLRDPIERTISAYYALLQAGKLKEGTSLVAFCTTDESGPFPRRVLNFQTACLSGLRAAALLEGRVPRPEDFDDDLLARAKLALDECAVVGLVERFDESLLLIGRTFGWPLLALRSVPRNVGKRRPKRVALTDEEREVVTRVNELDLALYRHAKNRFERLLAERVPDVPDQLRMLRRLNRAYRPVAPVVNGISGASARVRRAFGA